MKTRNRILLTIGSLLVIFSLCTSACATAPSPAPTPTPTPTPTPEPVKPIILKWDTFWAVDYSATVEAVLPTIKAIEEESKGRIKVEVYYAQSLVPSKSQVDYLATGVADVCGISWPYFPGVFTREQIQELPFALPPWDEKRPEVRQQIMGKMFDKYYYKEVDPRIVCLGFASTSDYLIMTTEKKVTTLEDLKGLKLRSAGGMHTDIVKALGATPAQTAPADMVESLSKGVLDGAFWTYAASFGWGISRYIKNSVGLTFCTFPMTSISMNKAKYDSMPKDLQDLMKKHAAIEGQLITKAYFDSDKSSRKDWALTEVTLSPEEEKRWVAASLPVWQSWMDKVAKVGENPKEMIAYWASLWKEQGYTAPEAWANLAK